MSYVYRVPGSKGYLVHIAHLHPLWQIRNAYVAMFGVTLSPTNCRVLKADGHFTVARTLYYPYHKLWVPGSKGYLVHIAHLHHYGRLEMRMWPCLGVTLSPTNCRVLKADGHFTVARTLYYPYHKLWVPGSKGYLVHKAPLHL